VKTRTSLFVLILLAGLAGPVRAATGNIPEVARASGDFRILLLAVERAGLLEALSAEGPLTVFAPTDKAFCRLDRGDLGALLAPGNGDRLRQVLGVHVVPGRIGSPELLLSKSLTTLTGAELPVSLDGGELSVGGARVIATDIACGNGVVHVLASVILPAPPEQRAIGAGERESVRRLLVAAIDQGAPVYNRGDHAACAGIYELAARAAMNGKGLTARERQLMGETLDALPSCPEESARAWKLRRAFDQVLSNRPPVEGPMALEKSPDFKVRVEAPLPQGFPGPGPVGEVVVKEYPRYRMARAEGGSNAFGTLFMHIKRNDIAMTAPVEMTMVPSARDDLVAKDMAFLYESTAQGRAGRDGAVAVQDLAPMTVLSVGLRGPLTSETLARARDALEAELAGRSGFERAGPFRQLGYNSPFMPERDRFFELQLPVKARDGR
jgi:uncharacterized surface protein with fasciclin (FAS1) repeats